MDKSKLLSGEELVARGVTRQNVSLPEVGVKDVSPNGSWLEAKQIEAALEARKHLIEVPRIEKSGNISHATWREDLMLAEVTKQVGPHWQFLGHHVSKHLYLKPEEALYLMEVNGLLLKYNEVTVSLQQAYSLLLRGKVTPMKYQVYSSLSRVGYKVFQHEYKPPEKVKESEAKKITLEGKVDEKAESCVLKVGVGIVEEVKTNNIDDKSEQVNLDSSAKEKKVLSVDKNKDDEIMEVQEETDVMLINNIETQNTKTAENCIIPVADKMESRSSDIETEDKTDQSAASKEQLSEEEIVAESESPETKQGTTEALKNTSDDVCVPYLQNDNEKVACDMDVQEVNDVEECKDNNSLQSISTDSKHGYCQNNEDTNSQEILNVGHSTENQRFNEHVKDQSVDKTQNKNESDKFNVVEVDKQSTTEKIIPDNNDSVLIDSSFEMDVDKSSVIEIDSEPENFNESKGNGNTNNGSEPIMKRKLQTLQKRKTRQSSPESLNKCFENFPDFYKKSVVTVNIPKEEYIPKHVFCNKSSYVLVTEDVVNTSKSRQSSIETTAYSESDEVNGAHVRRVRASTETNRISEPVSLPTNYVSPNQNQCLFRPQQFRQPHFWRQRFYSNNFAYPPYNFFARFNFSPRHLFWRPPFNNYAFNGNPYNASVNDAPRNVRKRIKKNKVSHLEAIKRLAHRLKEMFVGGTTSVNNIEALQSLIETYNIRYKTKIRLSEDFEVMDGETILETIELDDEEEPKNKRRKIEPRCQKYEENFNGLKKLAVKLKEMADKNELTSRHRRAFSNVLKEFNKTYEADVYMNENYQVIDRRLVTIDSSSESDCVVEETPNTPVMKGKLVRNPFNILKGLSQRKKSKTEKAAAATKTLESTVECKESREEMEKNFSANWLPKEDDFGRPEVVPRSLMQVLFMDSKKEEYLFDFIKNQDHDFDNWLDVKLAFFSSFEEPVKFDVSIIEEDKCDIEPILSQEDSLNMSGMLTKLSIIKNKEEIACESSLSIDFDVYNRDVQNFKKSDPPKPHFRVVCLSDQSPFPSITEVNGLHSKYSDNVTILFAIVCNGSVSYIQMNPAEIPVYVPNSDIDLT